jgi:hypothetical protein
MFYFFQRGSEYVRCELRSLAGSNACELVIAGDGQPERTERFSSWESAETRWSELRRGFQHDGWQGPLGRE